ncbi:hypothetical protein [Flavobacterium lipolyticum]|uniref:Bacterial CdiA-CT RNAse A domain-containing protein n=1 Tax=Flavobacterium lipolyticum TaxID=2893754 RepID=A0ABS8M3N4_9FLAO|nr:hypothetical protein [Flavobacterium sp. F-126]MCC9019407.1 hypothetical protein [Flavobacterium sp. F-126]
MKNIIKRFLLYLLLLSSLITNAGPGDPCALATLVSDLSTSGTEFKTVVKESDGFNAWLILNKEVPALRTNIDALKLVSKNLDEISQAGGYLKWKVSTAISRLENSLKLSCNDVIRADGTVIEDGNSLKLFSKNGDEIASINNGKILPKKYDYPLNATATPIGQPSNGYQIFRLGDDLMVRRIPDKSPYNATELRELTQHPKAHPLERHGHDVTDEALIKRSNEGFAPDGSYIGNNPLAPRKPPYSSKFETPQQLQKALNNTRPGTPAFNAAPITQNNTKVVIHELTDGSAYGKGVPKDGNTFQQSTKVRAVFEEVSPNNWQLVTMFPDF